MAAGCLGCGGVGRCWGGESGVSHNPGWCLLSANFALRCPSNKLEAMGLWRLSPSMAHNTAPSPTRGAQ